MEPVSPQQPPPECAQVVRQLWEYLDGRVGPESVAAIEEHLAECDGCRAFAAFERRIMKTLSGLRGRHSDVGRLRADVLKVLREAGMGRNDESDPGDRARG